MKEIFGKNISTGRPEKSEFIFGLYLHENEQKISNNIQSNFTLLLIYLKNIISPKIDSILSTGFDIGILNVTFYSCNISKEFIFIIFKMAPVKHFFFF